MDITQHKEIRLENLLPNRANIEEGAMEKEFKVMETFIKKHKLNQVGGVITAIHKMDKENGLLDMEIMIPVESSIDSLEHYTITPIFHLVNALHLEYLGDPKDLLTAYKEIYTYVADHNLQPITPLYNFYSNNSSEEQVSNALKVDMLIGVNPSII